MKDNVELFQNREISHLEFNRRVLLKAIDEDIPLLERLKFVQIFYNNMDEFFMTRVSELYRCRFINKKKTDAVTGLTPKQQIDLVCEKTRQMIKLREKIYFNLMAEIGKAYMERLDISKLNSEQYKYLEKFFDTNIFPLISPQIIDKHHPFPFLKNKEIYIYVRLLSKKKESIKIGIIPAIGYFDRVIIFPSNDSKKNKIKFLLVEDVILYFANKLFNKYKVISKTIFKVTRRNDINLHEETEEKDCDMKQIMSNLLKKRGSLSPVKLEIVRCDDISIVSDYLMKKLSLEKRQIFVTTSVLDISFLSKLINLIDRYEYPELFYPKFIPKKPNNISSISMIDEVLDHDILLSYPFDSMTLFSKLLDQSAGDCNVVSIKITLYRVAVNSQIVSMLKKAADNGKDVLVIVELKARFDEQNNIDWATSLEESGCKVIYGLEGYKIHAKILLITRKEGEKINYISQIGTGNYNEITVKSYTDLCLMTSNEDIGKDILNLFNNICIGNVQESATTILSSPIIFKPKFLDLISDEINKSKQGLPAQIIIKCNSLSDKDIMLKLIEASQAGVDIKLIIRGICCILPDVDGYTNNIEIISIIGRFLEHSRMFSFGVGENKKVYISSADLMVRNTTKRVEVICPIYDEKIKAKIVRLLDTYLKDNVLAARLCRNGEYKPVNRLNGEEIFNSQELPFSF